MSNLVINLLGVGLIFFILFWFWFSKTRSHHAKDDEVIEILVEHGVYTPSSISMVCDKTVTLRFIRKDLSPCADAVIFSDFDISAELSVDVPTDIRITPVYPGEYGFSCEMGMYRGKLVVSGGE